MQSGCGCEADVLGDHRVSCPRSGLLARRALAVEQAWVRVAREAVGPGGRVVPQQWLSRTTAPGVSPDDRRRLDLVVYGATERGETRCCDATLVGPVRSDGRPHAGAADRDGVALSTAERRKRTRYAELRQPGRSAWSSSRLRSVAVGTLLPRLSDSLPACAPGGRHPGRSRRLESALVGHSARCAAP